MPKPVKSFNRTRHTWPLPMLMPRLSQPSQTLIQIFQKFTYTWKGKTKAAHTPADAGKDHAPADAGKNHAPADAGKDHAPVHAKAEGHAEGKPEGAHAKLPEKAPEAPVDPKKADQDAEALHKLAGKESWYSFGNRDMFADKDGINNLLQTKTDGERAAIKAAYEKKYGEPMETALHFKGENDSDFQKFQSILNRKSSDVAGQASDRLGATLTEENQGWIHRRDQNVMEQDIRDTLRTHNHDQIEEIKGDYAKSHPGHTLDGDIQNNPKISQETKDAAAIYLKGNDKLQFTDKEKLAELALQKKDITMFGEAMQGMSATDRQAFMHLGGQTKIDNAFNESVQIGPRGEKIQGAPTEDSKRAMDLAINGKVSAATEIEGNTGVIRTNKEGVENAIKNMSDEDRRQYEIGKALASKQPIAADLNAGNMTDSDKKHAEYVYNSTHSALTGAGNDNQVAKWEDEIGNKNGTLVGKLAEHKGTIYNDGKADILKSVSGMSKADFDDAKAHPERREQVHQELERLKGARLNENDVNDIMKAYDQKMSAKDYAASQKTGNGDVIANIKNDEGMFKNDRKGMLDAITNMTPEEQQRYRTDANFKKQLDEQVAKSVSNVPPEQQAEGIPPAGPAYEAARRMLDGVSAGKEPKQDIVSKLSGEASDFHTDKAQVIRDVQQAFKDDPTLRDRLNNPKTPEDQQLSKDFNKALHECLSNSDINTYAKPLMETGHLAIDKQMDLDKGVFSNDKQGAFKDIVNASPEEIKKMQSDPAYRDKVLDVLSNDEDKKVAINIIKQGEAKPEDQIRERINHWGGSSEIMNNLKTMKPEELESLKKSYQDKYGSSLEGDLYSKLSGDDKKEATRILEGNITGEQAYNIARDAHYKEVSGLGAKMITDIGGSGTVAQSQDAMGDYSQAVAEANKNHEQLSGAEGKELQEKLFKTDDAVAKAKEKAADTTADVAIAAGGLIAAPFTGGLSLVGTLEAMGALGTVGAIGKVVAKGAIMGSDYDWSAGNVATDAGSGFAETAISAVGPAQAARLLGLGEKVGVAAAENTAANLAENGAENLLKQGGKEELVTASKELMSKSISEGAKTIEAKEINEIAEKVVAKELTGAAKEEAVNKIANSLSKNLGEALVAENQNVLKNVAERAAAKGVSGFAAGATGGTVEGVGQWDGSKGVGANLAHVGEKALATGAVVGGASMALSIGIDAVDPFMNKAVDAAIKKIGGQGAEQAVEGTAGATIAGVALVKGKSMIKDQILEKGRDGVKGAALKPEAAGTVEAATETVVEHHGESNTVQTADKGSDTAPTQEKDKGSDNPPSPTADKGNDTTTVADKDTDLGPIADTDKPEKRTQDLIDSRIKHSQHTGTVDPGSASA